MEKIECNTPEEIYAYFKQRADVYKTEIRDMEAGIYDWIGKKERLAGLKEEYEFAVRVTELVSKQVALKPDEDDSCVLCGTYLRDDNDVEGDWCPNCGQKFDWSH